MFRTFEQVESEDENAPAKSTGNLGLGLAVVARIISQLGGQLRVESKVGYGSKFTFVLHFRLPGPQDLTAQGSVRSSSTRASKSIGESSSASLADQHGGGTVQKPNRRTSSGGSRASGGVSIHSRHSEIDSLVQAISSQPASRSDGSVQSSSKPIVRPIESGQVNIEDSGTPVRSLRIDTSEVETPQIDGIPSSRPQMPGLARRATHANVRAGSTHNMPTVPARPQRQASAHAAPPMSPPLQGSSSPQRMRIMIVEDDAINRAILLKKLTKDFSHEVKQAVHGEEAVRLFEKDQDFDIVLMDLQ